MRMARTLLVAMCAFCLLVGCQRPEGTTGDTSKTGQNDSEAALKANELKPPADLTASETLKRLLATYRQAKTYRDNAVVRLAFRQNGQPVSDEQPFAVAYERPDKLSIKA